MALNTCEMWFNGIKIAFFSKKLQKNRPAAGGFAPRPPKPPADPRPPICDTVELHKLSQHVSKVRYLHFSAISLTSLSVKSWLSADRQRFQIFHPTISLSHEKFLVWKNFDDVIACDLWFWAPQSKLLATPKSWRLPEKLFWRPFFRRTLAAVSLVLGLGLEHSCPWPRVGLSSERLFFALASDFLCLWPWPRALCPRLHLW